MRKPTLLTVALLSLTVLRAVPIHAAQNVAVQSEKATVQLSQQQKNELAALYKDLFEKRKQLVSKYVQYGVITEEKGDKILSHMDKRYKRMEQNGFIPHGDKSRNKLER
ncbi:YckD family protein [Aneurinibacillus sp. Ricciae_BoGa-3]|uniref:YckD family protein n=1 Tax=Aneurinibacillus sp. Ricciae_BoGa-3 TaxID=3022697 RepID=UPI0023407444|nr:YckD family protein [Aneurinibacillus sp. Ricciae_BoGa-3]WCK56643.1 YckD family protein [Aneurinibacillus sp. Ricciae_BoGa-3]